MPKLNVEVLGDSSSLVRAFGRARSSARTFERDVSKSARGAAVGTGAMKGLGRSVAFASASFLGGAGLGFALKSSITTAQNFGQAMTLIRTQAGASAKEVDTMTKALEKLAPAVGFSPEELAKGLFHVESAGFRGAKALRVLKIAAEGAQVGGSDLEATTNALVAAQKSGIRGTESIKKSIGGLNAIVGAGNLRMEDLTGALGTGLLTAGAAVGLNLTDVGAALGTLTTAGVPARAAATRLGLTFKLLATQTPQAEKALHRLGIKHNELGDSLRRRGLIPTLELLQKKLRQSGLSATEQSGILSKVFGGGRTSTTAITLLRQLDSLKEKQGQITTGGNKFGAAWVATQHTAALATKRLHASVAVIEGTIGAALLPSVKRIAVAFSDWTGKAKNQKKIQDALHQVIGAVSTILHGFVSVVKLADRVTGSFKNTIIALTAAFVAFKAVKVGSSVGGGAKSLFSAGKGAAGFAKAFGGLAKSEGILGALSAGFPKAATKAQLFRSSLVGKAGIAGAAGLAAFGLTTLLLKVTGLDKKLKNAGGAVFDFAAKLGLADKKGQQFKGKTDIRQSSSVAIRRQAARLEAQGLSVADTVKRLLAKHPDVAQHDLEVLAGGGAKFTGQLAAAARPGATDALGRFLTNSSTNAKKTKAKVTKVVDDVKKATTLTAAQKAALVKKRNDLFDSIIDARLGRVGRLPLGQQLAALTKISGQLTARIKVTKDITRKLKLEQELFDVRQQRKDVQKQIAQNLIDKRTARQFRELGLTATGDTITPGVANLKKRLGSISKHIQGTFLDTGKTKSVLARIRKVLSEGLVPKDVRAKLKEMLDGLSDELKNHQQGQQTKFRHVSTNVLLSGLGLSPEQFRKAQQRLAQLGAGGTLPGQGSAAFAGAGAQTITVHTNVHLDGKKVAKSTTHHQRKANKRRTSSRRGPYAGRQ